MKKGKKTFKVFKKNTQWGSLSDYQKLNLLKNYLTGLNPNLAREEIKEYLGTVGHQVNDKDIIAHVKHIYRPSFKILFKIAFPNKKVHVGNQVPNLGVSNRTPRGSRETNPRQTNRNNSSMNPNNTKEGQEAIRAARILSNKDSTSSINVEDPPAREEVQEGNTPGVSP